MSWVSPAAGSTIGEYRVRLRVDTAGVPAGSTVRFHVEGDGRQVAACAARATADGRFECRADLLALGILPGRVTFDVDVELADGQIASSIIAPQRVRYAVPPPKPTNASWKETGTHRGSNRWRLVHTFRARWVAPAGYADTFLVYGSFECPQYSKKNSGTPCFAPGMPVDTSMLKLLATVPGDARSARIELVEDLGGCNPGTFAAGYYNAILIRARNADGDSAFAIAHTELVQWISPYDTVC